MFEEFAETNTASFSLSTLCSICSNAHNMGVVLGFHPSTESVKTKIRRRCPHHGYFFKLPLPHNKAPALTQTFCGNVRKPLTRPCQQCQWTGRIIFREIDCFSEVPKRPSFFLNIGVLMIQSPLWSTLNIDHAWGQKQVSWRAKHVLSLNMVWWFHPKFINWNPMGNGKGILIPTTMGIHVPHRLGHWEDAGGTKKGHLAIYIGAFGG